MSGRSVTTSVVTAPAVLIDAIDGDGAGRIVRVGADLEFLELLHSRSG